MPSTTETTNLSVRDESRRYRAHAEAPAVPASLRRTGLTPAPSVLPLTAAFKDFRPPRRCRHPQTPTLLASPAHQRFCGRTGGVRGGVPAADGIALRAPSAPRAAHTRRTEPVSRPAPKDAARVASRLTLSS
ncbi:hypothetical protein GCM10009550_55340 [Actinocorallia libanotica]|uniref:Uncharacterized protein n=1 Tax=Actinocorallia libanotica TaxID=46162 RepID=A0ABN1RQX2_9ACTN